MFANIFRSLLRPARPEDDESSSLDVHVDIDRLKDQEIWQRERERDRERRRAARLNNKSQTTGAGPPIELAPQITYGPAGSVVTDADQSAELDAPVLKRTQVVFPAHESAPAPMPQAQPHRHESTKTHGTQQSASASVQPSLSTRKQPASNGTYTMSGAGGDGIFGGAIGAEPTAEECMALAAAEEETRRREEYEASQPLAPPHPSHSPAISDVDYRTMNLSPGPAPSFIDSAPNPYQYQVGYKHQQEPSQPGPNTYDPSSIRIVNTDSHLHKAAAAALNDSYIPDGPIEPSSTLFSNFGVPPAKIQEPEPDKSRKRKSSSKPVEAVVEAIDTKESKEKEKEKQKRRRSKGSSKEVQPAVKVPATVQPSTTGVSAKGKEESVPKKLRKDKKEKKHKNKDKVGVVGPLPPAGASTVPPRTQPARPAAPIPILKPSPDATNPPLKSGSTSKGTTTDSKRSHRHPDSRSHHHHSPTTDPDKTKKVKVRTPEEEAERKRRKEERHKTKKIEKAMNSSIRVVPSTGAAGESPKNKEEDSKHRKSRKHKDGHKKKRHEGETEEERSERRAARRARKLEESLKAEEEAARAAAAASVSNASLAVPGLSHQTNTMDFEYSTRLSTVMEESSSLAEPAETVPPPPSLSPDPLSPYQEPERFLAPVPDVPKLDAGPSIHHEDRMEIDQRHHLDPPDIVMKDSYLNPVFPSSPLTPLAQAEAIANANISHLALPGARNSMDEKIPVVAEGLPTPTRKSKLPRTNSMQAPEVVPQPQPAVDSKEEKRRRRKEAERIATSQQQNQQKQPAGAAVAPPPAAIVPPEDARAARRRERAAKRTPEEAEARRMRREQRKFEKLAQANAALFSPPQQPGSAAGGSKLSLNPYQMSGAGVKSSSVMGFHHDPRTEPGFGHYGYGTDPRATSNVGFLSPPMPIQSPRHKKSVTIDTGPRDEGPGYIRDGKERQRQKERERARRQREKEAKAAAAAANAQAAQTADAANPKRFGIFSLKRSFSRLFR